MDPEPSDPPLHAVKHLCILHSDTWAVGIGQGGSQIVGLNASVNTAKGGGGGGGRG